MNNSSLIPSSNYNRRFSSQSPQSPPQISNSGIGGAGGQSSYSKSSSSSATSAFTFKKNAISLAVENMTLMLQSFYIENGIPTMIMLLFHLYSIVYPSLSIGFESNSFNYSSVGDLIVWIQSVLRSFGSDWYPYEAMQGIGLTLFAFELLTCLFLLLTYKSVLNGSEWWPKIKQVARALVFTYAIFNFVFVYWLSTFVSCDYSKDSFVLMRYSSVACWSEFNGSLVGLSIAFVLIQIPLSMYGLIMILESGNFGKSLYQKPTFLQMESFQFIVMLSVFNQIYIFVSNFIPPQAFVVRPVLHILLTVVLIIYILVELPFLNIHTNAVYCGIMFAKLGGPIGALISLHVNTSNSLELGLAFLLGAGVGSSIALFLIGFVIMEIYGLVITKLAQSARDKIMDEESQSKFIGDIHLKTLFKTKVFEKEIDEDLVKYATSKKNMMSVNTLIMSAIYTSTFHDNPQFSINTLKYALRQASFIQKITINSKIKELELLHGYQMTTEFSNMLIKAQKVENRLYMFRKLFWQYFVSNEDDQSKINSIVHAMYKTFEEGKAIYDLLVVSNPENQVLLKKRAVYLDTFSFRKVNTSPTLSKESAEDKSIISTSKPQTNIDKTKIQQQQKLNDQAHEYTEKIYREAINSKIAVKGIFLFLIYDAVALLVISIGIIVGVISSLHGDELVTILRSCQFTNVPYSLLREVRLAYYFRDDPSYSLNRFYERIDEMKHITQDSKIESYSLLFGDSLKYYSGNNFPIILPSIKNNVVSYTLQNVSIASLVSDIEVIVTKLSSWNSENFQNLESNYEYLYLLVNYNLTSGYFDNYCQDIVDNMVNQPYDEAVIVSSILLGLLVVITVVVIILRATLNIKEEIITLFSKIPKDIVGIIFRDLEKQTNKKCENSSYSEIFNFKVKMLFLLFSIFAVSVISLSITFYEAYMLDFSSRSSTLKLGHMSTLLINLHKEQLILGDKIIKGYNSSNVLGTTSNIIERSWIVFRYGTQDYPTNLKFVSQAAASLLEGDSSCSERNCTGLDSLLEIFVMDMDSIAFSTILSNQTLIEMSSTLLSAISDKIHLIGDELVNPMLGVQTKASLGVFSGFFILILILAGMHYSELQEYVSECNHTRTMLSMVPVDIIAQIEEIKQFVLHNKLEKLKEKGGMSKVRAIIDAASDGVFILKKESYQIELVNESGLKMLGYTQGELVDIMSIFGEGKNSVSLKAVLDKFMVATESAGEHLELEAIRKNGSSLSVGVSVSVFHHHKKNLITIILKDITFEKKHKLLLAEERKKSDNLLLNILPERIAQRLKAGETSISEKFDDCTCLFSDMVGFTKMSSGLTAYELVQLLNSIINGFDSYVTPLGLEKIKTIGDAYFCVGGLNGQTDHPEKTITFAIHMLSVIKNYNTKNNAKLNIRIGIHTGAIIAGCIGQQKFAYDLWGETLIIANLMESKGAPGRIQVSRKTYERVYDIFEFEEIKGIEIKPSVLANTYLLKEKHHDLTSTNSYGDGFEKMFAGINMFSPKTYNFSKIIQDNSLIQLFKDFLTGSSEKVNIINFYEIVQEYKSSSIPSLRFNMAENMVRDYLEESAPKRLQFKYMKNAFGPFQIKFKNCNEDNCPVDLFENFQNLCLKSLREDFPAFLKSKNFNKFLEQKKRNPEQLKPYVKDENDEDDEEDEKALLKFCEKCGTEIINLENHRFNDWEFNNRKELLLDMNQWRVHFETSGGRTYISPEVSHNHISSSRRHIQFKYVYEMNCKHKDLFNAWIDEKSLSTRVEQLTSSQLIDSVQVGKYMHIVCHEQFKMPFPHSKRELVHAYCCSYLPSEEVYLCISRSINNPRVPPSKQIRGEIKTAFMVKKLSETTCRYYYSVIIDCMGGMLSPEYYSKNIYKETQQDCFHVNLVKFVDEFAKEDRKPSGPLVNSLNHYLEHTILSANNK